MITLEYNGMVMTVSRIHAWSREQITDARGSYLFTRHTLTAECILNPRLNSFDLQGGAPVRQDGFRGAPTDASIRHFLGQPRKPFALTIDNEVVLAVTANPNGTISDMTNGPRPLKVDVVNLGGLKTWWIHFSITLDVPDRVEDDFRKSMISLVWSTESVIDFRLQETRRTVGTVQFRQDALLALPAGVNGPAIPDNFRKHWLPATPKGYVRQSLSIRPDPDGVRVHFECVDVQLIVQWFHFRRLEVGISEKELIPGLDGVILGAGSSVIQEARSIAGAAAHPEGTRRTRGVAAIGGVAGGLFDIFKAAVASTAIGVSVKAWGTAGAPGLTYADLIPTANLMILAVQGWVSRTFPGGGISLESSLHIDPIGFYVELERSFVKPSKALPGSRGGVLDNLNEPGSSLFDKGGHPTPDDLKKSTLVSFGPARDWGAMTFDRPYSNLAVQAGSISSFGETPTLPDANTKHTPRNP